MNTNLLKKIGLTDNEIATYDLLLTYKELTPLEIAEKLELKRTNSYAVLKALAEKGLANEQIKRKKLVYKASSPENLHVYAKNKLKELESSVNGVELYLPQIRKRYDIATNKEGARNYDGIEGIEAVFEDILREERNIYIIATNFEHKRKSVIESYKTLARRLQKRGLCTKVLVPYSATDTYEFFSKIASNHKNFEVKKFGKDVFRLDAEIIIYGPNAALISEKNDFLTVQIDSKDIGQTLKTLFMAFWTNQS